MRGAGVLIGLLTAAVCASQPKPIQVDIDHLKSVLANADAPLLIDLPEGYDASLRLEGIEVKTDGELSRFAETLNRNAAKVEGCWVFHRLGRTSLRTAGLGGQITSWLTEVDADSLAHMINSPTSLYSLPQETRNLIGREARNHPGLSSKIIKGEPVGIQFAPSLTAWVRRADGTLSSVSLYDTGSSKGFDSLPDSVRSDRLDRDANTISGPKDGALSFDEGERLTLRELLDQAEKTFEVQIDCDGRLSSMPVFVKGRFTLDRLLAAVKKIHATDGVAAITKEEAARLGDARRQSLARVLDKLETLSPELKSLMERMLGGEEVSLSVNELVQLFPGQSGSPGLRGLGDDTQLKFRLGFTMWVVGEGAHRLDQQTTLSNETRFGLGSG